MFRLFLVLGCALSACQPNPDSTTLFQDIGMSFEPCNQAEIKFQNQKHGMMPALAVCGSNHVSHFGWNPDGTHLYFDLTLTGNLLDASQKHKPLATLPLDQPSGNPAWINAQRFAVPLPPDAKVEGAPPRIALYDYQQLLLEIKLVPGLEDLADLHRGPDPGTVYFTAVDAAGVRDVYAIDLNTGVVSDPFAWLVGPVTSFTYTWQVERVVVGREGTVRLYDAAGADLGSFPGFRGVVHPKGQWIAIERDGEEVSVFYQRSWENMNERERAIAEKKAAEVAKKFPEWYPRTVKLPTLEMVHLATGKRGEMRGFYGTNFQWYQAKDFWGSFVLWGYEGRQLNRNVMLGDLTLRLGGILAEKDVPDIRRLDALPIVPGAAAPLPSKTLSPPAEPAAP